MRKILATILIILTLACLASCNKQNEAPEGLQIVDDNSACGYVFYGPEGWEIANRGGISSSYVSPINTTSISFARADMPTVPLAQYFDESMATLPYSVNVIKRDEKCTFGNATSATKYIYTFSYEDYDFACMQILVSYGEDFYIFTYNSYGDPNSEESDYQKYLAFVQPAIDSFKFKEKGANAETPSYEKDADGYNLVSDRRIAGYDLYLPDGCTVIDNGSMVTAKLSDNANISLSKASSTGVSVLTYIENRRSELSSVVSNIEDIKIGVPKAVDTNGEFFKNWSADVLPELDETIVFGDLGRESIVSYEYKYEFSGTAYHVYQLIGTDSYNGYVFTYTATEEEYSAHIDEVMTILKKVRF